MQATRSIEGTTTWFLEKTLDIRTSVRRGYALLIAPEGSASKIQVRCVSEGDPRHFNDVPETFSLHSEMQGTGTIHTCSAAG